MGFCKFKTWVPDEPCHTYVSSFTIHLAKLVCLSLYLHPFCKALASRLRVHCIHPKPWILGPTLTHILTLSSEPYC